jgi:hypothetical protein
VRNFKGKEKKKPRSGLFISHVNGILVGQAETLLAGYLIFFFFKLQSEVHIY